MNRMIKTAGTLLCLLFFNVINTSAQYNLVANPSFEEFSSCPDPFTNKCDIVLAYPWYSPQDSDNLGCIAGYVNACADYPTSPCDVPFNTAGGGASYQLAKTGNAYAGAFFYNGGGLDQRNTIQQEMLDSLKSGRCYYVEFFVNLGSGGYYGCNNIGIVFTDDKLLSTVGEPCKGMVDAEPSILAYGNPVVLDTASWTRISGIYNATGGEHFITIGNTRYDSVTDTVRFQEFGYYAASYSIDDVSVIPIDSVSSLPLAGEDSTILVGDSVFIGTLTSGLSSVVWRNEAGAIISSGVPGFYVEPSTTTFYTVEATVCGKVFKDTVYVTVNPVGIDDVHLDGTVQLFPNPTKGALNIILPLKETGVWEVTVTDVAGRLIQQQETTPNTGMLTLQLEGAGGVYFIKVANYANGISTTKKVILEQ